MRPVAISLRPSVFLQVALCLIHLLALIAVVACDMGWVARTVLYVVIFFSFYHKLFGRGTPLGKVAEITAGSDGTLTCVRSDGNILDFEIGPRSIVLPWIILLDPVMHVRSPPLLLARDSMDGEQYRLLMLWLLQRREPAAVAEVSF